MSKLTCGVCGSTTSSFFIVIGEKCICTDCKKSHKGKPIKGIQKPQIFTQYICKTHDCYTYSASNMMYRHEMKDCVIVTRKTLGIIRPATKGGMNGDIGRGHFQGVNEIQRLFTNLQNYLKFKTIFLKIYYPDPGVKVGFDEKKYYNKHLFFLVRKDRINFHKNDEVLKKLKFNLHVYFQGENKKFESYLFTPEERNRLYYKNIMKKFNAQIKQID